MPNATLGLTLPQLGKMCWGRAMGKGQGTLVLWKEETLSWGPKCKKSHHHGRTQGTTQVNRAERCPEPRFVQRWRGSAMGKVRKQDFRCVCAYPSTAVWRNRSTSGGGREEATRKTDYITNLSHIETKQSEIGDQENRAQ